MNRWIACLVMCMALVAPALAQSGSWRSIDESGYIMLALGPVSSQSGNIRSATVGYFGAFKNEADYGIYSMEFDCSTPGMSRSLGYKNYLINQSSPILVNNQVKAWEKAFMNEGATQLWEVVCGKATHGTVIKGSYAQMVTDYRSRYKARLAEEQKAQDAKKSNILKEIRDGRRAQALLNLVPETKTDTIQKSSHWHYTNANPLNMVIFDLHGAVITGNKVVTSVAIFLSTTTEHDERDGLEYDYAIQRWEFDCDAHGKQRVTAVALYLQGETDPEMAVVSADSRWKVARTGSFEENVWTNLCVAETPKTGLPRDQSFDQLLDWYRNQLPK